MGSCYNPGHWEHVQHKAQLTWLRTEGGLYSSTASNAAVTFFRGHKIFSYYLLTLSLFAAVFCDFTSVPASIADTLLPWLPSFMCDSSMSGVIFWVQCYYHITQPIRFDYVLTMLEANEADAWFAIQIVRKEGDTPPHFSASTRLYSFSFTLHCEVETTLLFRQRTVVPRKRALRVTNTIFPLEAGESLISRVRSLPPSRGHRVWHP